MLSRMMLSNANVLLFDEPTNYLDNTAVNALCEQLCQSETALQL